MKSSIRSFAVSIFFASLVFAPASVRADDGKPLTSGQAGKPAQADVCRVRYRDCLKLNHIPSSECQYIYQDCTRKVY